MKDENGREIVEGDVLESFEGYRSVVYKCLDTGELVIIKRSNSSMFTQDGLHRIEDNGRAIWGRIGLLKFCAEEMRIINR